MHWKTLAASTLLFLGCTFSTKPVDPESDPGHERPVLQTQPPQPPKGDWIVVLTSGVDGTPVRCWGLPETELAPGDGRVAWRDTQSGAVVAIHGPYILAQVINRQWDYAFSTLNMTPAACAALQGRRVDVQPQDPKARKTALR